MVDNNTLRGAMSAAASARPAASMPMAAKPADVDMDDAGKPRLVEVELRKKYCPKWIVQDDGSVLENAAVVKDTVQPGIVMLHHEDAEHVLRNGGAIPTDKTFRGV